MEIRLMREGGEKKLEIADKSSVKSLIERLKLNDETFIIKLNGMVAHEETELREGDELEFLNVIYGG